jgi:glutamate-5-semialdehyde dehydrogenase
MSAVTEMAIQAKDASRALATASSVQRNRALLAMAHALAAHQDVILAANADDMKAAKAKRTPAPLLDRLALDPSRVKAMSEALKELALLQDPIGEVASGHTLANGIRLSEVRVPLGVVAMIYEARPNVTVDAAGLCIKTGNAVILRGGSLAYESCAALSRAHVAPRPHRRADPTGRGGTHPLGRGERYRAGDRDRHRELPHLRA